MALFNLRRLRLNRRVVVVALAVAALAAILLYFLRRSKRGRGAWGGRSFESKNSVEICASRKPNPKRYDAKKDRCLECKDGKVLDKAANKCVTPPKVAGSEGTDCKVGTTWNGATCAPNEIESAQIGGNSGKYENYDCPRGAWIETITARYDNGLNELKNFLITCSDGTKFQKGYRAEPTESGDSFYEERTWTNPHGQGWTKVGYVTDISNKSGNRVRAFGPEYSNMFGTTWEEDKKKNFDCYSKGVPPKGRRYALSGMGIGSGTAIDRMKFRCSTFDAKK